MSALALQQPTIGGRKRWTHTEIVAAALRHFDATGSQPKAEDWRLGGVGRPNTSTVLYHFGSWSKMIEEAGLRPLDRCRPTYWTRELVIAALCRWRDENGRPPRTRDWYNPADWHPQANTVWRLFGSWENGLKGAGLGPRKVREQVDPLWSRDAIANAMLDHLLAHGKWPTCHEWANAGPGHPCTGSVKYRFGTWNAAKRYAGWDGTHPRLRVRAVVTEFRCAGCGGDENSETIGCTSCWDRKRTRASRVAARSGTVLGVVESPNPTGDSDAEADGNAVLPGRPVNHVAQAA